MNQAQEGADSLLDYTKPTEPVNLTLWQTCKVHPLPAVVALLIVIALIVGVYWASSPTNSLTKRAIATETLPVVAPEIAQTAEIPQELQATPKKIARQATKTLARDTDLPADKAVSDDILGDFIADLERKKALPASKPKEPALFSSLLEQDFETRLFNFERSIP
jgi:hypothetical protein